ncbi:MAG: hypothetical protein WA960_17625 [Tunicatimonas sp.]
MITRSRPFLLPAFALLLSSTLLLSCGGVKSAFSRLQKQQYPKASAQLRQAVEKDTLPVAAYYGYSLLYTDSAYASYNIDTAYQYAQLALATYPQLSEKRQTKLLRKIDLDTTRLQQQKLRIDSLAYARATQQDQLHSYQRFLADFATAPQVPDAIVRRNKLAYDSIQSVDTYPAYKYFMDTYPEAAQYPQAQQRYNALAFQGLTQEGDLSSYLRFLETYPNSPYRPQAERAIYEISTADGSLEDFARFARQYPRSAPARPAVNTLYHLYRTAYAPRNFLQDFPGLPYADSLRRAIRTEDRSLAPVLGETGFGFIDSQGAPLSNTAYNFLPDSYLCEGVLTGFVHAARQDNQQLRHDVLNKTGEKIFSFAEAYAAADSLAIRIDDAVVDRGAGLLEVTADGKFRVMHQGGHAIISAPEQVAEIELMAADETAGHSWPVPYQFIKFRVGEQWGLKAFSGRTLLEPAYASIEEFGPFVVLERDGLRAVTNRKQILANPESLSALRFRYDDVAGLNDGLLLVYREEMEGVVNDALNEVVPLESHQVVRRFRSDSLATDYWLLKHTDTLHQMVDDTLRTSTSSTYSRYEPENPSPDTLRYQRAFYNDRWLALKREKFWLVDDGQKEEYDSVQILGDHFVLTLADDASSRDSATVRLATGEQLRFHRRAKGRNASFRLLRTNGIVPTSELREFLWVQPPTGPSSIINHRGETILEQPLTGATVYPQGLIVTEQGRRQGLVDSLGNELLPARYEGIGNYAPAGTLSLFDKKKFGLYVYPADIVLEPIYESALTRYSEADSAAQWRFVAKNNGKYGIVTATNQRLTPFAFERVVYWNDSSALVKADGRWMIYRLTSTTTQWSSLNPDNVLYEGIDDFSFFQEGDERSETEQLLRIYSQQAYGVLSNQRGEVLAPTYDGISLFGDPTGDDYLYLTEKYVPEADLYILIYLNAAGKLVKRQALTAEQYDRLYCNY